MSRQAGKEGKGEGEGGLGGENSWGRTTRMKWAAGAVHGGCDLRWLGTWMRDGLERRMHRDETRRIKLKRRLGRQPRSGAALGDRGGGVTRQGGRAGECEPEGARMRHSGGRGSAFIAGCGASMRRDATGRAEPEHPVHDTRHPSSPSPPRMHPHPSTPNRAHTPLPVSHPPLFVSPACTRWPHRTRSTARSQT